MGLNIYGERLRRSRLARRLLSAPIALRRAVLDARSASGRRVISQLEARAVGDVVLRAPEFDAQAISVSPRSILFKSLLTGGFEPLAAHLFRQFVQATDGDVIDVGANIGLYSILAARQPGNRKVLAVEPAPAALARLHVNLTANNCADRIIVHEGVVSDHDGEATLHIPADQEEMASLGVVRTRWELAAPPAEVRVSATTLDGLVTKHSLRPSVIKIDVEGAEHLVFAGAQETLSQFRPLILCELTDYLLHPMGGDAQTIIAMLRERGYAVRDARSPAHDVPPGPFDGDIIAIPQDRCGLLAGLT